MLDYLEEREKEEWFRTSTRELEFPDGTTQRVEAYRLVWTWFDRSCAYEFGLDAPEILTTAPRAQAAENVDIGTAIGLALNYHVRNLEAQGADHTDDPIALTLAKRGVQAFHERHKKS